MVNPAPRVSPTLTGGEERWACPEGCSPEATAVKPWGGVKAVLEGFHWTSEKGGMQ